MKMKATGTVHSNSKSSARPGDKRQQQILHSFIGKAVTDSNYCRVEENPHAICPPTRVVSGTEGSDGDAFATLMTAVAAKKPVMVFTLTLTDGRLIPEIRLNSDSPELISTPCNDSHLSPKSPSDVRDVGTDGSSSGSSSSRKCDGGIKNSDADSWGRECRLPTFSFFAKNSPDIKAMDAELQVRTNIPPKDNVPEDRCDSFPVHHSLLKSMMQKAVRRRQSAAVIRLSLALARVSAIELLRRLPIICLEDGALHPSFPVLVWCMIASSKGYLLPDYLLAVCVHIIAEISESKYMDCLSSCKEPSNEAAVSSLRGNASVFCDESVPHTGAAPGRHQGVQSGKKSLKMRDHDIRLQPVSAARTLVLSVMLRSAFGGMAGDVAMLKEYSMLWYRRFFLSNSRTDDSADFLWCSSPQTTESSSVHSSSSSMSSLCAPAAALSGHDVNISGMSQFPMSLYMHPQWMSSSMDSYWGKKSALAFCPAASDGRADPPSSDATAGQAENDLNSSALALLRRFVTVNLLHNSTANTCASVCSPARALVNPAAPSGRIHHALMLQPEDLVPEGIDFHCDGEIVAFVLSRCSVKIIALIQSRQALSGDIGSGSGEQRRGIDSQFSSLNSTRSSSEDQGRLQISSSSSSNSSCPSSSSSPSSAVEAEGIIKSTIWLFRSSINTHKIWPLPPRGTEGSGSTPSCHLSPVTGHVTANADIDKNKSCQSDGAMPAKTILDADQQRRLLEKQKLAPFWGIICPVVRGYCQEKKRDLERRLTKFYRDTSTHL